MSTPPNVDVIFRQSSFFKQDPTPADLPSVGEIERISRKSRGANPVKIPSLGLLVKYGSGRVSVAEAQCLALVRQQLLGKVPVPEVYGWRE